MDFVASCFIASSFLETERLPELDARGIPSPLPGRVLRFSGDPVVSLRRVLRGCTSPPANFHQPSGVQN